MGQQIDPRFSPDKIEGAINNIIANGKPLNASRVRDELGGGDHGRIKDALQKHANKIAQQHHKDIQDSLLPPEMKDKVESIKVNFNTQVDKLAISCFGVAMNTAELRVKCKIDEYNKEIQSLENAEKDAFESVEREIKTNQDLMHKIEQLELKNETLVAKNAELNTLMLTAKERAAKLEVKENEISDLRQKLGRLEGKLESIGK